MVCGGYSWQCAHPHGSSVRWAHTVHRLVNIVTLGASDDGFIIRPYARQA